MNAVAIHPQSTPYAIAARSGIVPVVLAYVPLIPIIRLLRSRAALSTDEANPHQIESPRIAIRGSAVASPQFDDFDVRKPRCSSPILRHRSTISVTHQAHFPFALANRPLPAANRQRPPPAD